jgi:hypothetical protein
MLGDIQNLYNDFTNFSHQFKNLSKLHLTVVLLSTQILAYLERQR